jgi:hypothetical protein
MMSLQDLASFVCAKVGQYDSVAIALCRSYIQARYRMIWDEFFWRDTQMTATATLAAGGQTFAYPVGMERIVTLRGSGELLDPVDETFLLEVSPTMLDSTKPESTGVPLFYSEFPDPANLYSKLVRIYPTPNVPLTTFYLFGKRVCDGMPNTTSISIIRNIDNALIAYATGDMLERLRQYAKAQAKFQEAIALLEKAKALETQQANKPRRNKNLTMRGNSLGEMTDAVCGLCGQWTPDIRILVRDFLRRNYVALYDLQLWPETTVAVRVPFASEQVILPHFVDRVIAVRGADKWNLMPAEAVYHFQVDPDVFEQTGSPVTFSMLTPVAVATLPPTREKLKISSGTAEDRGKHVFIRGESNGTEVTEEVVLGLNAPDAPPAEAGAPAIGDATVPQLTQYAYEVPLTIAKDLTRADITVTTESEDDVALVVLPAGERERKHIRLWLLPPPKVSGSEEIINGSMSCVVLGKRRITPLRTDEDTPIITGAQGVLIAAAAADLYIRLGNGEAAAVFRQKAEASAKVLTDVNMEQNAYAPKIVPVIEPRALCFEI